MLGRVGVATMVPEGPVCMLLAMGISEKALVKTSDIESLDKDCIDVEMDGTSVSNELSVPGVNVGGTAIVEDMVDDAVCSGADGEDWLTSLEGRTDWVGSMMVVSADAITVYVDISVSRVGRDENTVRVGVAAAAWRRFLSFLIFSGGCVWDTCHPIIL